MSMILCFWLAWFWKWMNVSFMIHDSEYDTWISWYWWYMWLYALMCYSVPLPMIQNDYGFTFMWAIKVRVWCVLVWTIRVKERNRYELFHLIGRYIHVYVLNWSSWMARIHVYPVSYINDIDMRLYNDLCGCLRVHKSVMIFPVRYMIMIMYDFDVWETREIVMSCMAWYRMQ